MKTQSTQLEKISNKKLKKQFNKNLEFSEGRYL